VGAAAAIHGDLAEEEMLIGVSALGSGGVSRESSREENLASELGEAREALAGSA
jgi:hypothetical protein